MPSKYFMGDRPDQSGSLFRRIFIWICLAVLVMAAVTFGILYNYNSKLSSELSTFQSSLDSKNYIGALEQYRDVQAKVLSQDPDTSAAAANSGEKQIMAAMEAVVYSRVDAIETNIRQDRYTPGTDDSAFLEQLSELTGARLTVWLQDLCTEFLLGTIEKPTLEFIFTQVGDYTNVAAAAEPLRKEIDTIEKARGDMLTAESSFKKSDYISAATRYQEIIDSFAGFVGSYAQSRLEDCKKAMYDPIMQQCNTLLDNYRYYTAENILTEMAQIFPNDQKIQAKLLEATSKTTHVVEYKDRVEVLCIKPLIVDTDLAFSSANAASVNPYRITSGEFKAILQCLYDNDYILVDVSLMADLSDPALLLPQPLMLPENKKPVVIILEDVNYSAYQSGKGLCSQLVLNDKNQVCGTYVNSQGQTVTERETEAIGILDGFVEAHPDFTFDGAKGIVSFTGYETVMGYVTSQDQMIDHSKALSAAGLPAQSLTTQSMQANQETVKNIMTRLKETGWSLASSTYGFINANDASLEAVTADTQKWLDQVGNMTGNVDILVYPNGSFIKGKDPRCMFLKDHGFRIFFGIGPTAYYAFGENYLYLDRAIVNGTTLRSTDFSRLFNASSVYDSRRP